MSERESRNERCRKREADCKSVEAGSDAQRRWCCIRCDEKSTDATDVASPDRADDRSLHDADEK